jgi:cytochrome c biogenesis protein CcmG, thiol:disulfide interchange protein DsbE
VAGRVKLVGQIAAVSVVAALLALLVWRVATDKRSQVPAALEAGKTPPAPHFALPRLGSGGELALTSLRGKAVVVNFWASWCKPCKDEVPLLEQAWRKYRSDGLVVIGIDYDDFKGDAVRFAKRYGATYPIVHDREKSTVNDYGVIGVPETFFVNRQGKLVGERVTGAVNEAQLTDNIRLALRS